MKAYDLDLRQCIVEAKAEGLSIAQTAQRFKVSCASVKRFVRLGRETGSLRAKWRPGKRPHLDEEALSVLDKQVRAYNELSLAEHCQKLEQTLGLRVSVTTMHRSLKRLGITRKKDEAAERAQ